ncbi:MAG TPA: hypothetical protein VGG27_09110 [Magnetospirillaceae bacterium]|jgi:hypothetical protein
MDVRTITQVLSTLAELRTASSQRPAARLIAFGTVCFILAMWAGIAAVGCAAVALWSYALPYTGPVWTPLIVAAAFIIGSGGLLLLGRMEWSRKAAPPQPNLAEHALKIGQQFAQSMPSSEELERMVKDHAGTLAIAALVAGIVAGSSKR